MNFLGRLREKAKSLKAEIGVLTIAYADKRTPTGAKILIGLTIAYLLSPIDLIPDFIPVLGLLDDLVLVPLLIRWSVKMIPPEILADARQQQSTYVASKSRSWKAALIIILVWISLCYFLYKLARYFF